MTFVVYNGRFELAGLLDPEQAADRLRDEFRATARSDRYELSRSDIAAVGEVVTLALTVREQVGNSQSPTAEAWSQERVDAALAYLVERLRDCPTWQEAQRVGRVTGQVDARPGGTAVYTA